MFSHKKVYDVVKEKGEEAMYLTKEKTEKENILILVVFDRSGSMQTDGKIKEARRGYNAFIQGQKGLKGDAHVTLAVFDDQYGIMYNELDIKNVGELKEGRIQPRGMTRLYDAIGKTINSVKDESKYDGVILLIATDGEENDSREYTAESIKKLLNEKKELGWEVIFSGSSEEAAMDAGESLGIIKSDSYSNTAAGETLKWSNSIVETTCYRSGDVEESNIIHVADAKDEDQININEEVDIAPGVYPKEDWMIQSKNATISEGK